MHNSLLMPSIFLLILLGSSPLNAEDSARKPEATDSISTAKQDANGFLVHEIRSGFQSDKTQLSVLLPDQYSSKKVYPVVYVLPVEGGTGSRYGDGLKEVQKLKLHNRHQALFIAPTFSALPWYADHPTDANSQQETYFLKVVMPFVEKQYATKAESEFRFLLGFSKSGWGAWSLILRHPKLFAKAAAWDAPLLMNKSGAYGSGPIFGTQENFKKYEILSLLLREKGHFQKESRLILTGYGGFRSHHQNIHTQMQKANILHTYRDGPKRKHHWNGGWIEEAVELLLEKK